jgi:hypothetical protein
MSGRLFDLQGSKQCRQLPLLLLMLESKVLAWSTIMLQDYGVKPEALWPTHH